MFLALELLCLCCDCRFGGFLEWSIRSHGRNRTYNTVILLLWINFRFEERSKDRTSRESTTTEIDPVTRKLRCREESSSGDSHESGRDISFRHGDFSSRAARQHLRPPPLLQHKKRPQQLFLSLLRMREIVGSMSWIPCKYLVESALNVQ